MKRKPARACVGCRVTVTGKPHRKLSGKFTFGEASFRRALCRGCETAVLEARAQGLLPDPANEKKASDAP